MSWAHGDDSRGTKATPNLNNTTTQEMITDNIWNYKTLFYCFVILKIENATLTIRFWMLFSRDNLGKQNDTLIGYRQLS